MKRVLLKKSYVRVWKPFPITDTCLCVIFSLVQRLCTGALTHHKSYGSSVTPVFHSWHLSNGNIFRMLMLGIPDIIFLFLFQTQIAMWKWRWPALVFGVKERATGVQSTWPLQVWPVNAGTPSFLTSIHTHRTTINASESCFTAVCWC